MKNPYLKQTEEPLPWCMANGKYKMKIKKYNQEEEKQKDIKKWKSKIIPIIPLPIDTENQEEYNTTKKGTF